jgi:DNA-binding response OmpR family regulator
MKGRLFLVHWNAPEAEAKAAALRSHGWDVQIEAEDGGRAYQRVTGDPPDAVVIFLTRLPSHGRETGYALRRAPRTRQVPLLFVGGAEEAVARTRGRVPDALFLSEEALHGALEDLGLSDG